ncbi:MAG: radical SAM protein [Nanoarchaeota archaeon]|nr:radical SAM protein [Nanoarchaeota archaeon]
MSFGTAYLSAVLKKEGHQTSLICPYMFNPTGVSRKIEDFKPQMVVVSSVSDQFELSKKIIGFIYDKYSLPIVIGGVHPTVDPDECMDVRGVLGVCIGEGEYALLEFVDLLEKKKDYSRVKNFWFKKENKIIKNTVRPLIQDLDSLPFPDRELFDGYADTSNEIEFMGSRGCPYQCSYCINKVLQTIYKGYGKFVRFRSVDNLLREIKEVLKKYKSPKILFHDDTFTLNKVWLREFSEKYPKEIGKPYIANGRIETLDEESIKLLKKSGCIELKIGVESGNDRVRRKILDRQMTNERIIDVFRLCKKYGILATSFNMIGIPGETEEDIKDTIELNRRIMPFRMGVSIFKPYKGTLLYTICKENGWISNRKVSSYFEARSTLNLPTISHKKIKYYYKIFKLSVYHPILVQFAKGLIFIGLYDFLVGFLSRVRRFSVKFLTRKQKDVIMKILKI